MHIGHFEIKNTNCAKLLRIMVMIVDLILMSI